MKSMNCISATGRNPRKLIPQAAPTIAVSLIGVSITRSRPNFAMSPSVALNAPPYTPMSSPMATTAGSRSISSNMAWRIPSIMVIGAMSASPAFVAWILIGVPVAWVLRFSHGLIFRTAAKRNARDFGGFRLNRPHWRLLLGLASGFHDRLRDLGSVATGIHRGRIDGERIDGRRCDFFSYSFHFRESAVILYFQVRLHAASRRCDFRLRTLPGSFNRMATFTIHAFFGEFRRRHGRFFREFLLDVQLTRNPGVNFRFGLGIPDFIFGEIFFVKLNGIARLPILEHLLRNVFSRIVLRVAAHTHCFHFDQGWPAPGAALAHSFLRCVVHRDHIITIHNPASNSISHRAVRQVFYRHLPGDRRGVSPLVIFDDQHKRSALLRRKIQTFVKCSGRTAAIANPG